MSDDERSARQIAREAQRLAGDRSARLAAVLMKLPAAAIQQLELEDELREAIDKARAIVSHAARRRAERALAGDLRGHDLGELEDQIARATSAGKGEAQQLHLAEDWRTRLIEGGPAAAEAFPGGIDDELERLIDAARRERDLGTRRGAARALFRAVTARLRARRG
jgi:ribosome-associated protein